MTSGTFDKIPACAGVGKLHLGDCCWYIPSERYKMSINSSYSNVKGTKVLAIRSNGPAEKAGLVRGDLITHINGRPILYLGAIRKITKTIKAGSKVSVTYRSHYSGKPANTVISTGKNKKGLAVLGIFTKKVNAERYLAKLRASSAKKAVVAPKPAAKPVEKRWFNKPVKVAAKVEVKAKVEEKKLSRKEKKANKKAVKAAVAKAVDDAKSSTLDKIDREGENYFVKKARLEMAQLNAYVDDRNAADVYMKAAALKEELRSDNLKKLADAGTKVSAYLNKVSEPVDTPDTKGKGKLRITKKGVFVFMSILTVLSGSGATAAYFLL